MLVILRVSILGRHKRWERDETTSRRPSGPTRSDTRTKTRRRVRKREEDEGGGRSRLRGRGSERAGNPPYVGGGVEIGARDSVPGRRSRPSRGKDVR